jgi:hypothetical protein
MKATSISADGSVNGKKDGRKRTCEVVGLEEALQEIGDDALEVGKGNALAHPQAFDLVEHRRMGRIGIDAIDAARRDDADFGHFFEVTVAFDVRLHVARLDRAGMGTQQHLVGQGAVRVLQVERIVHRARRVILGRVQGGEIEKILFDFRAVGHLETDRGETAPRCAPASASPDAGPRALQRDRAA